MKIGAVLPAPSGFVPNWVPMPQFVWEYMSSMDFQVFAGASMIWDRVASEGLLPRRGSGER